MKETLYRLTIHFSEKALKELEEMAKDLDTTKTGVIHVALILTNFIFNQKKEGFRLFLKNEKIDLEREIIFTI